MQVIKKSFDYLTEDEYRDLDYGTIYYVEGENCAEVNKYVLTHSDQISRIINQDERNWITCKIVYLDETNPLFPTEKRAALYSPMMPGEESEADANIFVTAYIDITEPKRVEEAFSQYFSTLQQMFDEALDNGYDEEEYLTPTPLSDVDYDLHSPVYCECEYVGSPMSLQKRRIYSSFYTLSRLEITPHTFQVLLPDYNSEIMFTAQVKALYILFLHHPEGIRMKDITDYKEEYKQLYFCLTNRSDTDKLRKSVDKLLDVYNSNALNVKKSQCNSAIRQALPDEELYRHYVIEVVRGEQHKINLDRSLVSMPEVLCQ
ncbi:MAG: hypothetical protein IJS00_04570 [Paludibacteraceae bacterium]|nr:hypothetical protein [Paludibacteraceae bacterium]